MKITELNLPGVLLVEPRVFGDSRGYFLESWQLGRYAEAGISGPFVQDNLSYSRYGVLRGLHFQKPNTQGKLVHVLAGSVFDVAVDIRYGSPHFGKWAGATLSSENHHQLYVPQGFAHGFCVTSETALFAYKCTDTYNADAESSILWSDPGIGIEWPVDAPILSTKDTGAPRLDEFAADALPSYQAGE